MPRLSRPEARHAASRHADIRTTTNIYGDAASADMRVAHGKIVQLALESV
ncbi:MAG TPA: hypothetical protein VEU94_04915 [Terriglobales bacterium]|nr:hypothetical protein [Terriglobales bacterium]